MSTETERHAPLTSACNVVMQYPDSNIEHVCRLDHLGSEVHSCTCGLIWRDTSRDEELEQLRSERDALKAEIERLRAELEMVDEARRMAVTWWKADKAKAERATAELAEARAAIERVKELRDQWVLASMPADAPLGWPSPAAAYADVVAWLDAALDAPQRPEGADEDTQWRHDEREVEGGYTGSEFPRLWPPRQRPEDTREETGS